MGKRSRQRQTSPRAKPASETKGAKGRKASLRARADAANRVAEQRIKQRPKAPWDPFPLTELAIFAGIVLLVIGFFVHGQTGKGLIAAGVVLACLGGLETMLREHVGGYRAHSGLLAAIAALLALTLVTVIFNPSVPIRAAVGVGVFALTFPALRSAFIRKSGGSGVL